jgi:CubicO group peptidase (beta-lactamase class C family)
VTDVIVSGDCEAPYEPLRRLLHSDLERGLDIGAAMAVTRDGELVADLWGGRLEPDDTDPWERDTLVSGYSVGKIPIAIVVLMLWDRGLLDLDAPIADRWPEFGRNGKERITARQVLCHRAGVPSFGRILPEDVLCDWERMVGVVEEITPMFEPGTVSCYHPTTFGFILGELARRCSGASLAELVSTQLSEPLGVELYFGVADPTTRSGEGG